MPSFIRFRKASLNFLSKRTSHVSVLFVVAAILIATALVAVRTEYAAISSRNLIIQTYEVRDQIAALQIARAEVRATAFAYILRNDPARHKRLLQYVAAVNRAGSNVLNLVRDSPAQTDRAKPIQTLIEQQSSQLLACVESPACKASDFAEDGLKEVQVREGQIQALASAMDEEESRLVRERLKTWNMLFWRNIVVICIALLFALLLAAYSFRQHNTEIAARKELECVAQENAESFRALSARILELRDLERRKIARELHDSVGQYLAGLKMNLSQLASSKVASPATTNWLPDTIDMTDRAMGEIRTISHLLHPPLLDELGFESTAKWYVEEFAKRSGTQVKLEIGQIVERLPRGIELALFRALQESLTNVHKHATARSVTVAVTCTDGKVILDVRDDGKGIPHRVLQQFRAGGAAGIGLAGMRERLSELHGTLEVQSSVTGTVVRATLPTTQCESNGDSSLSFFQG